ncbi:MAG: Na+/H+ antiporter subunit E [Romboutsia sp.]|nr:Na+/H+ antiporter subunit E [Romboutsia sp.]
MFFITFLLLFIQWLTLSGIYDFFHFGFGVVCCLIVSYYSTHLIFQDKERKLKARIQELLRFPIYSFWLLYQIILANFYIIYIVFHPKLKNFIKPIIIELDVSDLENDFARVVLAQSITLTPGTISINLENNILKIYALNSKPSLGLQDMVNKVKWVFNTNKNYE